MAYKLPVLVPQGEYVGSFPGMRHPGGHPVPAPACWRMAKIWGPFHCQVDSRAAFCPAQQEVVRRHVLPKCSQLLTHSVKERTPATSVKNRPGGIQIDLQRAQARYPYPCHATGLGSGSPVPGGRPLLWRLIPDTGHICFTFTPLLHGEA